MREIPECFMRARWFSAMWRVRLPHIFYFRGSLLWIRRLIIKLPPITIILGQVDSWTGPGTVAIFIVAVRFRAAKEFETPKAVQSSRRGSGRAFKAQRAFLDPSSLVISVSATAWHASSRRSRAFPSSGEEGSIALSVCFSIVSEYGST
ncbi:hypothetical protein M413DRAFT_32651 [Hebeloma cylindrosporum]|uniref:Uncharacterized protein n=1 Tax=Hebeloma cylindrosporum TaxID=76867 RepID=A0A0C2Y2C1_HEBCY|nr:hypothetical protein M413DRAFT_32651 [Hebeloma cylindrosporum h7]